MQVAFIGMGTMGAAMATNIIKAGYEVIVHNRTRKKEGPVARLGAERAESPAQAAKNSDIIITCVSDTPDVEAVILGPDGVIQGTKPGAVVVDMSTISPAATLSIAAALKEKGVKMVDGPVSGGSEGAEKGTLTIMLGGDPADIETIRPVLETMGKTITHVGPIGSGQVTKAINQIIIAGTYLGVAEGMALGLKAGLDMDKVVAAVGGGAAASWVLANRSGNMIRNTYPLGFRARLHRKDLGIALETAKQMGVFLPVAAAVEQMENGLIAQGFGDEDMSALARVIRQQSGIK